MKDQHGSASTGSNKAVTRGEMDAGSRLDKPADQSARARIYVLRFLDPRPVWL